VLLLAPEFYLPLRLMGNYYHARMEAIGAAERIFSLLDTPVAPDPRRLPAAPISRSGSASKMLLPLYPGFRSGSTASALPDVGRAVAWLGERAGKSTMAALLLGFALRNRRVLVNGVDWRNAIPTWRRLVAWVPNARTSFTAHARQYPPGPPGCLRPGHFPAAGLPAARNLSPACPMGWRPSSANRGQACPGAGAAHRPGTGFSSRTAP